MANMSLKKNEMPVQAPDVRNKNFEEVALGYTKETALDEASRCLNCKKPMCIEGCPVGINIPGFIEKIRQEDFEGAYDVISISSSLPAVCGRVCPQEKQCESRCVRGVKGDPVGIGRLERFVADLHNAGKSANTSVKEPTGKKVAIVGSGPSGLACAGDLAKKGYRVTVFEALHTAGGVLVYGIPEFRLPKAIVKGEIEGLKSLGVKFETNVVIGKSITVDELFDKGFEAVFIGSGAGLPRFMNIPGENLKGVYSANEFLTRINLMKAYREVNDTPVMRAKKVAVVGGGNVAMDACRCAKRLGAEEVYIVYRRSLDELPARKEEVEHAMEEGIIFKLLNNPVEILGDDTKSVCGMKCIEMELGEPDASGRRSPVEKAGSEFVLDVDCVIMAIGTSPNPLIKSTTQGLEINKKGGIVVNEDGLTSRDHVYAGGDAVTGAATVILAMGAGKTAAAAIDAELSK
jgi:glutamate synthase (NADPH/NADH) small chain